MMIIFGILRYFSYFCGMKNLAKLILPIICLLILAIPSFAQTKKKGTKNKSNRKEIRIELSPTEKLYESMLAATAKVMFVDSIVVDKALFINSIPLTKECGMITSENDGERIVYTNEFNNHKIYSQGDSVQRYLYITDRLVDTWSAPKLINELADGLTDFNYPFLMPDGVTLYFSAKGEKSLGGLDIFVTRFDSRSGKFYKPENYGLPFNSKANDYFIAFDDIDSVGWLVSDRYQPEGKVCIYTFATTASRQNYDNDGLTHAQLKKYADLNSIRDTWAFGNRQKILKRLALLKGNTQRSESTINFAINDKLIYHRLSDFKTIKGRQAFESLMQERNQLQEKENALQSLRERYATSSKQEKQRLQQIIIQEEQTILKQRIELSELEKRIRNYENNLSITN